MFEERVPKVLLDAEVDRRKRAEEQLDQANARIRELTDRISTMRRRDKFDAPAPRAAPRVTELSDEEIVRRRVNTEAARAAAAFLENATRDLMAEGMSQEEAQREAVRMREAIGYMGSLSGE